MTPEITPAAGDELRVCITRDGHQVCATVSSAHLVSDKLKQLEQALQRHREHAQ